MRELICTKELTKEIVAAWFQAGVKLRVAPMIQTFPLPFHVDIEFSPSLWIFTSPRAVEALGVFLKNYYLPILSRKKIVAIGQKTTEMLVGMGFKIHAKADNALALAEEINMHFPPQSALHFCGNKRRHELGDRLTELRFQVFEKVVYQTKLTSRSLAWDNAQGAIFFSPSAVESFFMRNEWPLGKVAYAIGPTTASALQAAGVRKVLAAKRPQLDALLELILTAKKYV